MNAGDRVWYLLRRVVNVRWIPATVQSVGKKRVVIVDDQFKIRRVVDPKNLKSVPADKPAPPLGEADR